MVIHCEHAMRVSAGPIDWGLTYHNLHPFEQYECYLGTTKAGENACTTLNFVEFAAAPITNRRTNRSDYL